MMFLGANMTHNIMITIPRAEEYSYYPIYVVLCLYFLAYGGLVGLGGLVNRAYVYKYPVTTAGCNITDSDLLANLTSPVYDPATWDPQSHFRYV